MTPEMWFQLAMNALVPLGTGALGFLTARGTMRAQMRKDQGDLQARATEAWQTLYSTMRAEVDKLTSDVEEARRHAAEAERLITVLERRVQNVSTALARALDYIDRVWQWNDEGRPGPIPERSRELVHLVASIAEFDASVAAESLDEDTAPASA